MGGPETGTWNRRFHDFEHQLVATTENGFVILASVLFKIKQNYLICCSCSYYMWVKIRTVGVNSKIIIREEDLEVVGLF